MGALTNGLPQSDCYVNVLRDAMAWTRSIVRDLLRHDRRPGLRVADAGDTWSAIVRDLPPSSRSKPKRSMGDPMIRVACPLICATSPRSTAKCWSTSTAP
jgi:hypothetical protein